MDSDFPRTVLVWHVHGSWMESFVAGPDHYLIPVNDAKDVDGRGLLGRSWPRAEEISTGKLRDQDVDLIVLQRPHEVELAAELLGRCPGVDIPAVYVEHSAPRPYAADSQHVLATRTDIPIIHVTEFNRLMWNNDPLRRWRTSPSTASSTTGTTSSPSAAGEFREED